jgi:hypothetical protein
MPILFAKEKNVMMPQEWTPGQLLEISGYLWKTGTLPAAVSEEQITDMLRDANVGEIRCIPMETPNDSGIII